MTVKKKALALIIALVLAGVGGWTGIQYYYDYLKPPKIAPKQVVEQYFEALKLESFEEAFAMVSHRHYPDSFNQFMDRVSMYSPDMRLEISGETMEDDMAFVEAHIVVPMRFGPYEADTHMTLVRVKREWKIIHP